MSILSRYSTSTTQVVVLVLVLVRVPKDSVFKAARGHRNHPQLQLDWGAWSITRSCGWIGACSEVSRAAHRAIRPCVWETDRVRAGGEPQCVSPHCHPPGLPSCMW